MNAHVDLGPLMEAVAIHLLGEPSEKSKTVLRWGSRGSLSVSIPKGTFYDHETGTGGGVLDLIERETGKTGSDRMTWLADNKFIDPLPPLPNSDRAKPRIVNTYDYRDEVGALLSQVCRLEPKDFRQRKPDPARPGEWQWSIKGVRQVPYHLPELIEEIGLGKTVFIVEGEKDVDRLRGLGIPATTNAAGANKWRSELTKVFAGADVVIIPDNDLPGQDHAQDVAMKLAGVAAKVRVLDLKKVWPEMPSKGDVSDWLNKGGTADALYGLAANLTAWSPASRTVSEAAGEREFAPLEDVAAAPAGPMLIWFGDTPPTPPPYLVDETLPEVGVASIAGQWGAAKTFVGADLALAVIVPGGEFAGKAVNRKGGCVWFAAEGENEIETRVKAAIGARGGDPDAKHPFARQAAGVPCLTDKDALDRLRTMVKEAAAHMRQAFDCDLVAIFFDTLAAAAGFEDENSAPETQKVMNLMRALATEFNMLVVFIDHYGKVADTGIRGSSAKSGAADAILACLGDRNQETGAWSNRRMALAKLRSGSNGAVVNFSLAQTADGETCTVVWSTVAAAAAPKAKAWPKALVILKRAFDEALGSFGKDTVPRVGMPVVKAVDRDRVRDEFMRLYPADKGEDPKKAAHAKNEAFRRAVKDAVERGVLCSINVGPDLAQGIIWAS